ncbi:WD40 repeat-like protein [Saitoella complicata NRRL Y-17804]|uniref:Anaphase-promoting complex subunit 4-like WD40 domain-containing protein n=1 Tax=Saitoella complicata (strain BCRC 22490 / CBS 7301 / JCM 7358 / NBRC 10748 / NRRL Y-17804) TaxID=698492 RepID=A0A0E9NFI9_SAICN|nr:WD40 repeat-like protein [Saitoella complicata NRRL Y-17804]ODQ52925.1 WD40 repeat-like protein [Saitoella complicata NRRL Y-17804]GAO48451.1 hypothetical protein G7K_2624-t1 [Saitoella complicata NRRL Y-17804]
MSVNNNADLKNDFELSNPPEDSISDMAWSSQQDFLAVASWDKKMRIYEVLSNGQTIGKAMWEHEAPVLSCHWSKDGTKVASGGADKAGRIFDIASGQSQQVAAHDAPIKSVRWIDAGQGGSLLATGSWDKTVKYWDLRQQSPVATLNLPERVYAMDVVNQLMVVGTAERHICIVNLSNPTNIYKTLQSPLKWQTRTVACFPNGSGYAVGSIEGRCAIQYIEDKDQSLNFSFKCHRETPSGVNQPAQVYAVNALSFHPLHGTFSTAGSDGSFHFWDKDSKHRLKGYNPLGATIPCTAFNHNGTIFAYALSYDWSKGYQTNTQQYPNKIMLHATKDEEVKPRPKGKR